MKKLVSTFSDTKKNSVIWGEFRFAVIGQLIVSHIARGQIGTEIKRLSERTWKHPISGQDTTFCSATIERWYYRALNASSNPILALGPLRSDSGSHRALSNDGYSYLHKQFQSHKQWGYRKLYNRLEEFSKKRYWLSLPNYSTVRRYLIYMEQLPDHEPNRKAKKLDSLVCHLRRCLITQSVRLHLFKVSHQKNNIGRSLQSLHNLESTKKQYVLDRLQDYKRAGGNKSTYCQFTGISPSTILRWSRVYKQHGLSGLVPMKRRKYSNQIKAQQTKLRVLEIFHNQPRIYGINRSSWSGKSLAKAFQREYRESISAGTARRHLRKSGYTMRRARQVLTSTDPEYRQKVELLIRTLRSLRPDEVLFFIDEMGPMRVKKYGGRIYTKKGSTKTFPQVQANKGSVTLSGALCATTNQMTWIYGKSKNTSAMIDLIEVLFNQYIDKSRIYITWDAASWHSSDQLVSWLDKFNEGTNLTGAGPIVDFIPLPACAQFLDIIEAVFGGMKKAVIHHSDYATEKEMKVAISRHFEERNEYFKENPRRAGKKIWSIDFFSDYEHLRSGNYREW